MVQIYLLVVAINIVMGAIIILDRINSRKEKTSQEIPFLRSNTFILTLTVIAFMTAFFCLVTPYGQSVISKLPLLGDLFPILATFLGALVFLTRYMKQNSPEKVENSNFFTIVETNEYYVGIACVAISVIHFLFPAVLFL